MKTARARSGVALAALGGILVITISWWALALWPVDASVPSWVLRTRAACFGTVADGLPDVAGWILLIGEPLGMIGVLVVVWGDALRRDLRDAMQNPLGVATLIPGLVLCLSAFSAATQRVRGDGGQRFVTTAALDVPSRWVEPVPAVAPPLHLTDQHGRAFSLERVRGRRVLVTFAYAHCQTICPTVVHDLQAARRTAQAGDAVLVVVTLDPWRDVPARLATIASGWQLSQDDRVLSGTVDEVQRVHRAWGVVPVRDERTGDVMHVATVMILDGEGRVRYQLGQDWARAAELLRTIEQPNRRM